MYYELSPLWSRRLEYEHGCGERVRVYAHRLLPRMRRVTTNA
jgi:hypothetical protein